MNFADSCTNELKFRMCMNGKTYAKKFTNRLNL